MTPAPSETAELITRLRQQLILAQVRIMELEDERDQLVPRLAEIDNLLRAAQQLADGKGEEAAHLTKVLAEALARAAQLNQLYVQAAGELSAAVNGLEQREKRAAELAQSIQQLESELDAIKSSRSWRWTSWLR
jgi:predicted  nucleic acid-binding Zn-ribbon protein